MKILLINPPTKKTGIPSIPPLGLAYLAAVIRDNNIIVDVIDYDLERKEIKNLKETISLYKPDIVGLSAITLQIDNAYYLAQTIKKISKNILIVLGGPHPSALPERTLLEAKNAVDIVVIGEGEMTILDIVSGKCNEDIKGIAYIKNDVVVRTPPREPILNLDSLPHPARDLLKIKNYRGWGPLRKVPTTHLISSRGCPFECVFCSEKAVFGKGYRVRSALNIVDEVEYLVEKCGMKEVAFYDDLFTLDKQRVISICDEIIRRKISVDWKALSRVNTVDYEMLAKMRQAGCWLISYGFESGSQGILDAIRKNQTVEQCIAAADVTRKAGIKFYGFFMIGNVGETKETVLKTIKLARRLKPDYSQFTIVRPDPGSYLYSMYKKEIEGMHISWGEYYAFSKEKNTMPVVGTNLSINDLLALRDAAYMCVSFKQLLVGFLKAILTLNPNLLGIAMEVLLNKQKTADDL